MLIPITEYKIVTALCHASEDKKSFVTDDGEEPFDEIVQAVLNAWDGELAGGLSVQLMSQTSPVRVLLTQAMRRKVTAKGGKRGRTD
jgi:hypothetical protein